MGLNKANSGIELGKIIGIKRGKKPELFNDKTGTRLPYLEARFMRGTKKAMFAERQDKNSVPVNENDLIIICDGSKSGDTFSGFKGVLSSTMGKLVFDDEVIEKDYLEIFLKKNFYILNRSKKGAAIPHLDFTLFNNLVISLPPLSEQKKIVARLDDLLGKVRELVRLREEALADTEKFLSSRLREVFEDGKKQGWSIKFLEEVCEINMGQSPPSSTYNNDKIGLPFYQGKKDYGEKYPIPRVWCSGPIKTVELGDILISVRAPVGALNIAHEKSCIGRGLAGLRSQKSFLDQRFLFWYLKLQEKDIEAKGTGSTFKSVSKKDIANIEIPIPNLNIQEKIVKELDKLSDRINQLKTYQRSQLEDLKNLERSILHKAFSGELVEEKAVSQQPIPSPFYRNQVNAAIIEQVSTDGGATTEVAVAKYNYLLQEICGVPLGYEFAESKFGPFDAKIKNLIWSGLSDKNKWFSKSQGMVVKGQNSTALLARKTNLYWKAKAGMKRLADLEITKLDVEEVELLSTVYHSIKQVGSTYLLQIREFMSTWETNGNQTKAEKFSEGQTQKYIDFIVKNELYKAPD